jgi:hypothetical protein
MVLHDATRIGSPNATWGVIEGNPIQDDVREIARMTGVTFSLDVTLNRDQQITAVFGGELFAEHGQACASAKSNVMRAVEAPFDVVLTTSSGYPWTRISIDRRDVGVQRWSSRAAPSSAPPSAGQVANPGRTATCSRRAPHQPCSR